MALSYQQIEADALQAGWAAKDVPTIAAIVMAESGGDPMATNWRDAWTGGPGRGLAQITPGSLADYDPIQNLRDALSKFQSQGWGAWSTFTGGQFQQYLGAAQSAFAGVSGGGTVSGPTGGSIGDAISGLPASVGHGLANFAGAGAGNIGTWVHNNIVGLLVGLVVALMLWSR